MNTRTIIVGLAVVILLGGGLYWYTQAAPGIGNTSDIEIQEGNNSNNPGTDVQGKLDINVVCESALAYMTFPDGESADQFVAECKAGEHPEVIERYKSDMGYESDAAI